MTNANDNPHGAGNGTHATEALAAGRGLDGVIVTQTRLSYVDGERGELVIGGFPVEELAPRARFEEVLYLLWHGQLPTAHGLDDLCTDLAARRALPRATVTLLQDAAARKVPVMDALRMAVATLSLADPRPTDVTRPAQLTRALALVAQTATIVAHYWRLRTGRPPVEPAPYLGHTANYLFMLTGSAPAPEAVRALETYLNTVIDHGFNASTFAARVIISTRSDMVSAIVGAIGALKGPLHGGAPGPALDMVLEVQRRAASSGRSIADEADALTRAMVAAGEKLMGFGHRVYKVRDPRAALFSRTAAELFARAGDTRLYDDARTVEGVVVRVLRELKPGRRLETNMEYYTALLLHGLGLESDLFTPTFAVARVGGWTAHVLEQFDEDRLIRPSALYVGARDRAWVPREARLQ
jgi:citrate synthase